MIDIRIVCTHDAVKLAETLTRLLEAEEHQVRLVYGRQSLGDLEEAKTSRDAVLLIWSPDAPSQHYMLEWARHIDPSRLVEIARTPGWPRIDRKAPVIDFTTWRGERGARAWNALNERLRAVTRVIEPPKPPPKRAALALGLASVAAVSGAMMVRMNDVPTAGAPDLAVTDESVIAIADPSTGVGGVLSAREPLSVEDLVEVRRLPNPRFTPIEPIAAPELIEMPAYEAPEIREPGLLERLREFNPLRDDEPPQE